MSDVELEVPETTEMEPGVMTGTRIMSPMNLSNLLNWNRKMTHLPGYNYHQQQVHPTDPAFEAKESSSVGERVEDGVQVCDGRVLLLQTTPHDLCVSRSNGEHNRNLEKCRQRDATAEDPLLLQCALNNFAIHVAVESDVHDRG
jgi:hypothetical protein